jgi:general secretion pathway protein D
VPFFGSIPGIGRLFRSEGETKTKRNLLIFLRPNVVRKPEDATVETQRKYQEIWDIEIISRGRRIPLPDQPDGLFRGRQEERTVQEQEQAQVQEQE